MRILSRVLLFEVVSQYKSSVTAMSIFFEKISGNLSLSLFKKFNPCGPTQRLYYKTGHFLGEG